MKYEDHEALLTILMGVAFILFFNTLIFWEINASLFKKLIAKVKLFKFLLLFFVKSKKSNEIIEIDMFSSPLSNLSGSNKH